MEVVETFGFPKSMNGKIRFMHWRLTRRSFRTIRVNGREEEEKQGSLHFYENFMKW